MKTGSIIVIFLTLWALSASETPPQDPTNAQRRHSIISLVQRHHLRTSKRSPLLSPLIPNFNRPRILNKTPLNLLQNGPYYINHYIWCDNLDHHTLDQIKSGAIPSNKDIHFLQIPKDKYNFDGLGSLETPSIDLELNKHVDNFEVTLEGVNGQKHSIDFVTPLYVQGSKTTHEEIVTPLIQGQVSGSKHGQHKYNLNLEHLTHYVNGHTDTKILNGGQNLDSFGSGETNRHGEFIGLPGINKHPLEDDLSKSSYDSPGAVDSYGHPVTDPSIQNNLHSIKNIPDYFHIGSFGSPNLAHIIPSSNPNSFIDQFGNSLVDSYGNGIQTGSLENSVKGGDYFLSEIDNRDYITQLNKLDGLHRSGRQVNVDEKSSSSSERLRNEVSDKIENKKAVIDSKVRYSNHKYD